MTMKPFEVGATYNRAADIHARYGGQQRGGIATPAEYPFVFLFTGSSGERYGYDDATSSWANSCARRGNTRPGPDAHGNQRRTIVFHLVPESAAEDAAPVAPAPAVTDLAELRRLAMAAASPAVEATETVAKRITYERSAVVRAYVLARAAGVCESCGQPAPFNRPDGSPYLEPHHTRRVSDGGPDDPRFVGAICPNCHREIHHGQDGAAKNAVLQDTVSAAEALSI